MNERLKSRLRDAQQRIEHLERRLADSRRASDGSRQAVMRLMSSRTWRLSAPLRHAMAWVRKLAGLDGAARAEVMSPAERAAISAQGQVAEFLAMLPADAIASGASSAAAGDGVRLIDLASTMEPLLGRDARELLSLQAADADEACIGQAPPPARIALLGSSELMRELAFEAAVTPLHEHSWSEKVLPGRFDFLLVETVCGVDGREWCGSLTVDGASRSMAERMLQACHEIGLPVVLWFRESPDRYDRFAWLAGHADVVYAVQESLVVRFAADYPDKPVAWLPPAVQPAMHNPVRPAALRRAAGMMAGRILIGGTGSSGDIASDPLLHALLPDLLVSGDACLTGPVDGQAHQKVSAHLLGCLDPIDRIGVTRLVGAMLFRDSKPDWRGCVGQLRAAASGALPVGPGANAGLGLDGAGSGPGESPDAQAKAIRDVLGNRLEHARTAHLAFRKIFSEHCMADRLQRIADDLRLPLNFKDAPPKVACLLVSMRPGLLPACIERFRLDVHPNKELVIVVHDGDADLQPVRTSIRPGEPIRVFQLDARHNLGACLNHAFAQTDAPYWCKWDDDDFYGPNYLSDFLLYRRAVDFDVAGKPMAFTFMNEADELRWDPKWADRANLLQTSIDVARTNVAGGTLFGHRRVLESTPFCETRRRGVDSEFLQRCHGEGWSLLSIDPFNFVRYRTERPGFHTWPVSGDSIQERTTRIGTRADLHDLAFI